MSRRLTAESVSMDSMLSEMHIGGGDGQSPTGTALMPNICSSVCSSRADVNEVSASDKWCAGEGSAKVGPSYDKDVDVSETYGSDRSTAWGCPHTYVEGLCVSDVMLIYRVIRSRCVPGSMLGRSWGCCGAAAVACIKQAALFRRL